MKIFKIERKNYMAPTKNRYVLDWIDEQVKLTQPDKVVWITGEEDQLDALRKEAFSTGELFELNQDLLPGCSLHRTAINDVARVEDRTFICTPTREEAGPTNNWMEPSEMYAKLNALYDGAMKGRTMYVIPYSMGVIGSPFAKYGIELTDSIYVVLNMAIMTRVSSKVLDALGDSPDYIKGLHAKADIDENNRYIVHFPQDNTICSVNSGYGGNVLLGKKCFALRIASYLGRNEGWFAEHMLILGIENPQEKFVILQQHSHLHVERQTWPCSYHPRFIARRVTRFGALATTSLGCVLAKTADCGQ